MKPSQIMLRSKFRSHHGKRILSLNFSNLEITETHKVIEYSSELIQKVPKDSIYTLTNITDAKFDQNLINALKQFTNKNKPYVIAGAVIGVEGIKKTLFNTILLFSGRRNLKVFSDEHGALAWLTTQ